LPVIIEDCHWEDVAASLKPWKAVARVVSILETHALVFLQGLGRAAGQRGALGL